MRSIKRTTTAAVLGLALASVAGCYSGGGGGGYDYYEDGYYGYDARPAYYYDGGYHDHHYRQHRGYHREARRVRVPRDADVVANGAGGLAYTPDRPGRVYVRDEKTGKVVYSGRVRPGQDVLVGADAKGRRVSVDGRTARGDLSSRPREREVYFRPDRGAVSSPNRAERREAARAERAERVAERRESRSARAKGKDAD
jgi:hypothetical protein